MRLGLTLGLTETPVPAVAAIAQQADAAGYELLLMAEAWGRDALVMLSYLAARTERIQLGTGIINVFSRSPGVVAMAAATLDDVSGGRAFLGLGISGRAVIEGWHGVPFTRPMRRLREYVAITRKILRQDRSRYDGEVFQLAPGFTLRFRPPRPDVPIGIAALSPGAIQLAAEVADAWFPYLLPPEQLRLDMDHVQVGLARAGRPRQSFTVAPYVLALVDEDVDVARRVVKEQIAFYVGGMGQYYHQVVSRAGYSSAADQIRAEFAARRREAAADAVPDELVDRVAVCGPAERCRRLLAEHVAAGADMPVLYMPVRATQEQILRTIAALGAGAA